MIFKQQTVLYATFVMLVYAGCPIDLPSPASFTSGAPDAGNTGTHPDGGNDGLGVPLIIAPGNARLLIATKNTLGAPSSQLSMYQWTHVSSAWDLDHQMIAEVSGTVSWVRSAISPDGTTEIAAALAENDMSDEFHLFARTGSDWSTTAIPVPANFRSPMRSFDLSYEQQSGRGIVVYSVGEANPRYRIFENGSWSEESAVFSTPPADVPQSLSLSPTPDSNAVVLAYYDAIGGIVGVRWNGTKWLADGPLQTVIGTTKPFPNVQNWLTVSHDQESGTAVLIWADYEKAMADTYTLQRDATAVWEHRGLTCCTRWIDASVAAEQRSNRIAVGANDGRISIRDQQGWTHDRVVGPIEGSWVGWIGRSGALIHAFSENQLGQLNWRRLTGGIWSDEFSLTISPLGAIKHAELISLVSPDQLLAVFSDDAGRIASASIAADADWIAPSTLLSQEPISNAATKPFSLSVR